MDVAFVYILRYVIGQTINDWIICVCVCTLCTVCGFLDQMEYTNERFVSIGDIFIHQAMHIWNWSVETAANSSLIEYKSAYSMNILDVIIAHYTEKKD